MKTPHFYKSACKKRGAISVSQSKSKQNKGKKFAGLNSNPGKSKVIQAKIL